MFIARSTSPWLAFNALLASVGVNPMAFNVSTPSFCFCFLFICKFMAEVHSNSAFPSTPNPFIRLSKTFI